MSFVGRNIILLLLGCVLVQFCQSNRVLAAEQSRGNHAAEITGLSPAEAQILMEQNQDLLIVDVRTSREREQAAIAGSIHIPLQQVFQNKVPLPYDRPLLIYCAVGGRSSVAAQWLRKKGFSELYNLLGGISEWQKQGLPIIQGK